jgi:RNA polymerase-binding transcription factor DksA
MADPTSEPHPTPRAGLMRDARAGETDKILGTAAHPSDPRQKLPPNWRRFYDQLIQRRDQLIDAETDMAQKAREIAPNPLQDSPAEIGTSEFQRDQLLGMVSFDQETLEEVNAALDRMEQRTYGICESTGKPIPEERLAAVPWARYTLEAQREMEVRGQTPQAAIGPRGEMKERGTAAAGPWREKKGIT